MKCHKFVSLVEFIILFLFFIYIFTPVTTISITASDLMASDYQINNICLNGGNYRIAIDGTFTAFEDTLDPLNAGATVGFCSIYSKSNPDSSRTLTMELKELHSTTENILVILPWETVDDLCVAVSIDSTLGSGVIQQISIRESRGFRVVLFMLVFLFLLSCNRISFYIRSRKQLGEHPVGVVLVMGMILVVATIPFLRFRLFYGDDMYFHLTRINSIAEALRNRQFPVRIYSNLLNGYGYASPIFYGDILLYLPALLYLFAVPLQTSYICYVMLINLGTGLLSYHIFRRMFSGNVYGLAGAFLYTLAPYRLTNLYLRFSVGEYSAMLFLPLIVYGFQQIVLHGNKKISRSNYLPLVIGMTGVIQTHLLTGEMTGFLIVIVCFLYVRDIIKPAVFLALVKSCVCTVLLNAGFLIPFLDFMQDSYMILDDTRGSLQSFGLTFHQLWIYLIPVLLTVVLLSITALRGNREFMRFPCTMLLLGILSLVMTSAYFPWNAVVAHAGVLSDFILALQFPWRYLTMASICLTVALLGGIRGFLSAHLGISRLRTLPVILLACLQFAYTVNFYQKLLPTRIEVSITGQSDLAIMGPIVISGGEYLPSESDLQFIPTKDIPSVENVSVSTTTEKGTLCLAVTSNTSESVSLLVPLVYYRHYLAIDKDSGDSFTVTSSPQGLVSVNLPPEYCGTFSIAFCEPWYYRAAELCSLVTLLAILWWLKNTGAGAWNVRGLIRAVGSASHSHCGGREFESPQVH